MFVARTLFQIGSASRKPPARFQIVDASDVVSHRMRTSMPDRLTLPLGQTAACAA
jgi:hypothetical protein